MDAATAFLVVLPGMALSAVVGYFAGAMDSRLAAKRERKACAEMCFAKATAFGKRADECEDQEDATELKARAWQMLVMGEEIAKRSNAVLRGEPLAASPLENTVMHGD